ncbi:MULTISPECIES: imelysin family protein [Roseobacteraceae]|uniref:Imelysin n=1 Tax=Pseudosulfitobacter pseudonitzschiae TaxID=1402135 RepID=A0A221K236_9RHOB|nr:MULTISPECIES: imelysin family protein [Roseobacteraceae]ASM73044.1 imelysin [Pseudosulfitobacter pseudonitzschiae]
MRFAILFALLPFSALADGRVDAALDQHILPSLARLADSTAALAGSEDCAPIAAWAQASDAWQAVSHLRFGPTEVDIRGFALAYWPDPRGATPKALNTLLGDAAPAVADASVAGRGFYAMEFLLFDPAYPASETRCALMHALADDASATATAIAQDWTDRYAALLRDPSNPTYQSDTEALQELYKALQTGLEFTSDTRIGRPLGSFDRPRAARAEMRRSGRSLNNVVVSLTSLQQLAQALASQDPALAREIDAAFDVAFARADEIARIDGGADFSLVDQPQNRLKLEVLQQNIDSIRDLLAMKLGPQLGVSVGFNSLDGD